MAPYPGLPEEPVELRVATAYASSPWESTVVSAFDDRREGIAVVRRCVDVADLLAVAAAGIARTALVWPELRFLDRDVVRRLEGSGVAVVGVCDPGDERARPRLAELGVGAVVDGDAEPAVVAEALRVAASALVGGRSHGYADPAGALPPAGPPLGVATALPPPPGVAGPSLPRGRVVAVWGPTGAPGRSTLALGIADEAVRLGVPALLVDADVYGGVQSPLLGLLDESAGLATACRLAVDGRLDLAALAGTAQVVHGDLRVLTGLSRPDRWPELRPAGVEAVLDVARTLAPLTVVDCAFCTEEDEELSYDTTAPRRNAATTTVLTDADVVLCVVRADPVGITRAVRALVDLRERFPEVEPVVVANRLRGAAAREQVDEAFRRFAGTGVGWYVEDDAAAVDQAVGAGCTLAEVAPRSAVRQAIRAMAADLAGVEAPARRRRGRR